MAKLEEAYGKEMTEGRAAIYFENLHMYSITEIEDAVNRAIREQQFFPTVATLIKFIEEERQEQREPWPTLQVEYKEQERLSPEEAKKRFKMIYKLLAEAEQKAIEEKRLAKEEKRVKEEERRKMLAEQKLVLLSKGS